ncbi:MAG TPA: hypothetical protein VMW22_07140 [Candidatus Desulfaltia sp.]|nr:hypothetical protein [Candidatus Desulfaltia sp.]
MEIIVFIALMTSTVATLLGVFSKSTKQTIALMALQAAAIGFVELMYVLVNLVLGLHMEALVKFIASFAEWFSAAAVSPLIIYWGMVRTADTVDKPLIDVRRGSLIVAAIVLIHLGLWVYYYQVIPKQLEALPFISLMFTLSVYLMVTRRDPLKVLVGLNMAENALFPLLARSPMVVVPFLLVLMIFVNMVGVFIVMESHKDYGSMEISDWRLSR